jgi:ABC-2 type transport system permease protein
MTSTPTTPTTASRTVDETLRLALFARSRPTPPGALSASLTFAWRALLRLKHVPEQLLDVIAIPIIFTLMFTYLFGGALAGSTGAYLQFLLPGTLVMAVLLVTIYAGIGLNTDITSDVFDRFRALAIWRPAHIVGALLGDVVRYLLASSPVIALGLAFAFGLSWIWTALGLVVRAPGAVTSVGTTVLFPLTLASNVFVDPRTMPEWLRVVVDVNPVTHLVIAARGLMAGTVIAGEVGWALLAPAALTAVFAPLTMYLYRNKR